MVTIQFECFFYNGFTVVKYNDLVTTNSTDPRFQLAGWQTTCCVILGKHKKHKTYMHMQLGNTSYCINLGKYQLSKYNKNSYGRPVAEIDGLNINKMSTVMK